MLNADLLYTAAMCHDIGKIHELSPFPENDYTDAGQLLGHIMIGAEMVAMQIRQIPDFPVRLANELKHLSAQGLRQMMSRNLEAGVPIKINKAQPRRTPRARRDNITRSA